MGHQILYAFLPYVLNFPFSMPGILFLGVIATGLILCLAWGEKPRERLRIILLLIFSFITFIYASDYILWFWLTGQEQKLVYPFSIQGSIRGISISSVIATGLLLCWAWREKPRTRLRIILLSIFSFIIFCFAVCVFFLTALGMGGL